MASNLSILGLYRFDDTIFDNMVIPNGVDRDTLVDNILIECAEVEILYADPDFIKFAIQRWSEKEIITWNSLYETFNLDYNPIWNVDANERTLETHDLTKEDNRNIDNIQTNNLNSKDTHNLSNLETRNLASSNTDTHQVVGFNSSTLTNNDKNTIDGTDTGTIKNDDTGNITREDTGTIKNNGTDDLTSNESGTIETVHTRGGNIGVTMTQQLLEAELSVRPKLNIYEYIINSFKKRFCLMIY